VSRVIVMLGYYLTMFLLWVALDDSQFWRGFIVASLLCIVLTTIDDAIKERRTK
jgi:hypothetical protein